LGIKESISIGWILLIYGRYNRTGCPRVVLGEIEFVLNFTSPKINKIDFQPIKSAINFKKISWQIKFLLYGQCRS
jgi:hypothetical protein